MAITDKERQNIGENIRTLRKMCGITQQQMEEEAGLARNTVSNAENGADIKMSTLLQIIRVFKELLGEKVGGKAIEECILDTDKDELIEIKDTAKSNTDRFLKYPVKVQDNVLMTMESIMMMSCGKADI